MASHKKENIKVYGCRNGLAKHPCISTVCIDSSQKPCTVEWSCFVEGKMTCFLSVLDCRHQTFLSVHVFVEENPPLLRHLGPRETVWSIKRWEEFGFFLGGAESRVGFSAAGSGLGGHAGRHGARDGVTGAGGALQGLLCNHLPQRVLLLYLEDVWLLCLVLTDTEGEKRKETPSFSHITTLETWKSLHADFHTSAKVIAVL